MTGIVHEALSDCTVMLYVMTERWRPADRYRRSFEILKQVILDRTRDRSENAATPSYRDTDLSGQSTLHGVQQELGIDAFSHMIMGVSNKEFSDNARWNAAHFEAHLESDVYDFDDSENYDFDPLMSDLSFLDVSTVQPDSMFGL